MAFFPGVTGGYFQGKRRPAEREGIDSCINYDVKKQGEEMMKNSMFSKAALEKHKPEIQKKFKVKKMAF